MSDSGGISVPSHHCREKALGIEITVFCSKREVACAGIFTCGRNAGGRTAGAVWLLSDGAWMPPEPYWLEDLYCADAGMAAITISGIVSASKTLVVRNIELPPCVPPLTWVGPTRIVQRCRGGGRTGVAPVICKKFG